MPGYIAIASARRRLGSTVTEHLARDHGESLIGIHLTDVPFHHLFQPPKDPSPTEAKYLKQAEKMQKEDGAWR